MIVSRYCDIVNMSNQAPTIPEGDGVAMMENEPMAKQATNVTPLPLPVVVRKIEVSGEVKARADMPAVPFKVVLDFTQCSETDVLAIACDNAIVKLQGKSRVGFWSKSNRKEGKEKLTVKKLTPADMKEPFTKYVAKYMSGVVNVKETIVNTMRGPAKSNVDKAADMVNKLSPAEKAAMLKLLAAK